MLMDWWFTQMLLSWAMANGNFTAFDTDRPWLFNCGWDLAVTTTCCLQGKWPRLWTNFRGLAFGELTGYYNGEVFYQPSVFMVMTAWLLRHGWIMRPVRSSLVLPETSEACSHEMQLIYIIVVSCSKNRIWCYCRCGVFRNTVQHLLFFQHAILFYWTPGYHFLSTHNNEDG